jgi:histidyl-tRNA synthetase
MAALVKNATSLGIPEDILTPDFSIARCLDYYTDTVYDTFVVGREN